MVKDETETKVNMSETEKDSDFLFRQGDKRAKKKEKLEKFLIPEMFTEIETK